mgnify:CR=1 FL=1|jgi:hypothetical protein
MSDRLRNNVIAGFIVVAFQRALETSEDTTAIVAEKARLRDITNQVDTMTTLDELKSASI